MGLTSEEARKRLAETGPNEPSPVRRGTWLRQTATLFLNPLVVILLVSSAISAAVGELTSASIIAAIVVLSVAVNFYQTYRSQLAVEALRSRVALTAWALRDGAWSEIPRSEIVPGDVIRLEAGSPVPADGRLVESKDLHIQQAALTGESFPAEKDANDTAEGRNLVFLGTSVVSGTGIVEVVATGRATQFGDIAARLATRAPQTEFEHGIQQFGMLITRTVFFLVLFVMAINLAVHRNALDSFLFSVALAVGLTPEFLPMITTVTLARGAVRIARHKVIVKNLASIQNFGSIDVLCSDKTGTLTTGEMRLDRYIDLFGKSSEQVLELAWLDASFATGAKAANPLDAAILQHKCGVQPEATKLDEIPFDFERRRHSVVLQIEGARRLIVKGAPETVLAACSMYSDGGAERPLDAQVRAQCDELQRGLAREGYRVLAVAAKRVDVQTAYRREDETGMVLAGFLAFVDPPLPNAGKIVQALRRDGIDLKILTGDSGLVAEHVCAQLGIATQRLLTGEDLEHMSDTALAQQAEETTIFARVSPAQKNRIILALKARGHVVGYLGDGINDAPSLHAADVGISVAGGVEVARDAADIILLKPGLAVLHQGILEGRKAFGNVMKYLLMGTSSNFGNMFSMAAASFFLKFLPMLPMQILLNNFLYDLAQITIPTDNVDPTYIRKPRRWDMKLIRDFMIFIGPVSSLYDFLTFYILLRVFHAGESEFHTGWFVESLATQTLVLFVIRTAGNPFRSRPSMPLTVTTLSIVAIGIALPFTSLAAPLGFTRLPGGFFLFLAIATSSYLVVVEFVKRALMSRSYEARTGVRTYLAP
jgi:P-type Mg2+ transporter